MKTSSQGKSLEGERRIDRFGLINFKFPVDVPIFYKSEVRLEILNCQKRVGVNREYDFVVHVICNHWFKRGWLVRGIYIL